MRVELSLHVSGVDCDAAVAWWADFREGRHDHGAGARRILSRDADGAVTMEDRALLIRERTTARRVGREVRFEGENTYARFDGAYAFAPEGDGCRVRLDARIHLRAALTWADAPARPLVRAILAADLRHHAREMARELR